MTKKIIICDIDGTIANIKHRLHFIKDEDKDWVSFYSNMDKDDLIEDTWKDVELVSRTGGYDIVFLTGRPEEYRELTETWLKEKGIEYEKLLMRKTKDHREDTVVKEEIYNNELKDYEITVVYEDRPSVIRMWREKGLTVIDVGPGKEF